MEEILVVSFCLVLNALFAAFEMAFVSVSKPELRKLARSGVASAKKLLLLREHPERTLSIIQIGITLVGAVSAAVGGAGAAETLVPYLQKRFGLGENAAESIAITSVVLPLTYLNVVVGELVPKSIALRNALGITLAGARWLFIADRILSPAVTALDWSTRMFLRILPRSKPAPPSETTLEIDNLAEHHQRAVLNLAYIETRKLQDLIVPWKDVTKISANDSPEDVALVAFASGHTRLPVVENESVLGVLHTKEFLALREAGHREWRLIIRPILKVQTSDPILALLRLMQAKRSHMAVVYRAGNVPIGIVTFEDISEEIWGELYDEDEDSRVRRLFAEKAKSKLQPPRQ
jgi:putative hemolysin